MKLTEDQKYMASSMLSGILYDYIVGSSTHNVDVDIQRGLQKLVNNGHVVIAGENGTYTITVKVNGGAVDTEV